MTLSTFSKYSLSAFCFLALASSPAFAKKGKHYNERGYHAYDNHVTTFIRAKVLDVQPVYARGKHHRHGKECWIEPRYGYHQQHYGKKRRDNKVDVLVGSVVGGVIGNQFGSGSGNKIATVAGAVVGGAIANEYSKDHYGGTTHRRGKDVVRVCDYDRGHHYSKRVKGYNVSYRFKGDVYHTFTREHPGRHIKLRVNIQPLG